MLKGWQDEEENTETFEAGDLPVLQKSNSLQGINPSEKKAIHFAGGFSENDCTAPKPVRRKRRDRKGSVMGIDIQSFRKLESQRSLKHIEVEEEQSDEDRSPISHVPVEQTSDESKIETPGPFSSFEKRKPSLHQRRRSSIASRKRSSLVSEEESSYFQQFLPSFVREDTEQEQLPSNSFRRRSRASFTRRKSSAVSSGTRGSIVSIAAAAIPEGAAFQGTSELEEKEIEEAKSDNAIATLRKKSFDPRRRTIQIGRSVEGNQSLWETLEGAGDSGDSSDDESSDEEVEAASKAFDQLLHQHPMAKLHQQTPVKKRTRANTIVSVEHQRLANPTRADLIAELKKLYVQDESDESDEDEESKKQREYFNSPNMLLTRESIKFSARIRALLTMVWLAADSDHSGKLDRDEYFMLNRKLQMAVIGKFDEKSGYALAQKDWDMDSRGKEFLNFNRFSQSWFQIVDLWTDDVDEQVYYDFLYQLTQRMITVAKDGTLQFREDRDIVSQKKYEQLVQTRVWKAVKVPRNPMLVHKKYGFSRKQAMMSFRGTRSPNKGQGSANLVPLKHVARKVPAKDDALSDLERQGKSRPTAAAATTTKVGVVPRQVNLGDDVHEGVLRLNEESFSKKGKTSSVSPKGSRTGHFEGQAKLGIFGPVFSNVLNTQFGAGTEVKGPGQEGILVTAVELAKPPRAQPYVYYGNSVQPLHEQARLTKLTLQDPSPENVRNHLQRSRLATYSTASCPVLPKGQGSRVGIASTKAPSFFES